MFHDTFENRFIYLNGFLRNVSRFGSRRQIFDPRSGCRWTYRELNAEANRLAHALRADGVGKNDVVMFTLPNLRRSLFSAIWRRTRLVRSRVRSTTGRAQARLHSSLMTARPRLSSTTPSLASCPAVRSTCARACLPSRSLSARTMPYLPVRCAMRITLPISRRTTRRSTRPAHLRRDHPFSTLPGTNQPSEGRADQQYQRGAFRA